MTSASKEAGGSLLYVLPFALFLAFLALQQYSFLPNSIEFPLRVAVLGAVLLFYSRPVIDLRVALPLQSILVGIAVFVLWILPDTLMPHYRESVLFQNAIIGKLGSSLPPDDRYNPVVLVFRFLRAAVIVPIVEELFWRAWLMRWVINPRFQSVPLGTYAPTAFWITALLFASEHGPYWDVGLLAGIIYNAWMIRTKRLGDCVLAHAVTNTCLSVYTIVTQRWEYWY